MKFKTLYFLNILSLCNCNYLSNLVNPLQGEWSQVYNNRYVKETSEIDWDCINVNITDIKFLNESKGNLILEKSAIIHHNIDSIYHKSIDYNIYTNNGELVLHSVQELSVTNPILLMKKFGPIINEQYDYIILIGTDNLSLFILARDIDNFNSKYINEISDILIDMQFIGYYKSPLSSYTSFCK